jgi:hypothetical protein
VYYFTLLAALCAANTTVAESQGYQQPSVFEDISACVKANVSTFFMLSRLFNCALSIVVGLAYLFLVYLTTIFSVT